MTTQVQHPLILKLDIAGNPHTWITYEQAAFYYAKELIAWTVGDHEYKIYGGNNRITATRSSMDLNTIIAVKGSMGHNHLHRAPTLTNKALFRRDQNICAYCGGEFSYENLTRDHIIPSSRGGRDIWTNVVAACGGCNKVKDDFLLEEINMQLLYVPYAPSRSEHLILMNRNILANQLDFLKAKLPAHSRLWDDKFKETIQNKKKQH